MSDPAVQWTTGRVEDFEADCRYMFPIETLYCIHKFGQSHMSSTHHAKPIHQVHSKIEGKRSMLVKASPTCFRQSAQARHINI